MSNSVVRHTSLTLYNIDQALVERNTYVSDLRIQMAVQVHHDFYFVRRLKSGYRTQGTMIVVDTSVTTV